MAGKLHYLNADFDLGLRPRSSRVLQPALRRGVRAMTVHALWAGGADDAVLLRAGIPKEFTENLESRGFSLPCQVTGPPPESSLEFSPFGWSAEAIAINAGRLKPAAHPGLEVVRQVNSRGFSAALDMKHFEGEGGGRVFTSAGELLAWLAGREERREGWVIKADHGNAGLANRRLRRSELDRSDRKFVDELFAEDDRAVLEPWHHRLADLCTVFTLTSGGEAAGLRTHETVCTSDGALIGALFGLPVQEWGGEIGRAAGILAAELHHSGYFGPVCFDSYTHSSEGGERLRVLADLNCRHPVSDAIFPLWRDHLPDRVLYWRFFSAKRLCRGREGMFSLPCERYDREGRRGILQTSPSAVVIDGVPVRAPKVAVAFIGESRDEVESMERTLRKEVEK